MKKIKYILLALLLILLMPVNADELDTIANPKEVKLYLFHQSSCPHCNEEIEYLDSIKNDYPTLEIIKYEISENVMNYNFFNKVIETTGMKHTGGVPFTIIGTDYYEGFDADTKAGIKYSIEKYLEIDEIDVISMVKNEEDLSDVKYNTDPREERQIPIIGTVNAKEVSLPLISIIIGLVDGFNPCSMWVLLFLITILFNMKDKKKMWTLGIVFLATSALVYLLFMLAWFQVALSFTSIKWIRYLIFLVALIGGIVNLRSYIKTKISKVDGCEIVNEKERKKTFTKIKKIVSEKKFILAIIGMISLAVSVNFVELACSAGLPLVFTQVLAINEVTGLEKAIYMALYIIFFLLDDIVVFVIAMTTLNIKGISSKYGKYSHLIGGILMIIIAFLLILKPEWLMFNFK